MIVFVGDKPSIRNLNKDVAFVGTPSYKTLLDWICKLDIFHSPKIINSHTPSDIKEIIYLHRADKHNFIALGNKASAVLYELEIKHFKLPHPSPRNRQLNNPEFIKQKLQECKEYLTNG